MESLVTYECEIHDRLQHHSRPQPPPAKPAAKAATIVASLLLFGGLIRAVSPAAGELLTLDQAIALAGQNNRLVKNSSLDVDKAVAQIEATKTRRLPAFSFRAQANQLLAPIQFSFAQGAFGSFPATGPIPSQDTKLETSQRMTGLLYATISQPLLEQFSINKNIELGEINKEAATEQLRNQRQTVVANIKRTYFGLIQTQSSLESAEEAVRLYRELERLVKEQVRQQKALEADHMDMRARLA
ncbi:MAG: TolC family protein, partial [Nitrospiraceae bacterium]